MFFCSNRSIGMPLYRRLFLPEQIALMPRRNVVQDEGSGSYNNLLHYAENCFLCIRFVAMITVRLV